MLTAINANPDRPSGGVVVLTSPEEAAIRAEWDANLVKVITPKQVTMRQARIALLNAGLLATTETAIAGMLGPAGDKARIEWEFSQVVMRDWPLVAALMPTLGLTSAQVDQLFITAATL